MRRIILLSYFIFIHLSIICLPQSLFSDTDSSTQASNITIQNITFESIQLIQPINQISNPNAPGTTLTEIQPYLADFQAITRTLLSTLQREDTITQPLPPQNQSSIYQTSLSPVAQQFAQHAYALLNSIPQYKQSDNHQPLLTKLHAMLQTMKIKLKAPPTVASSPAFSVNDYTQLQLLQERQLLTTLLINSDTSSVDESDFSSILSSGSNTQLPALQNSTTPGLPGELPNFYSPLETGLLFSP